MTQLINRTKLLLSVLGTAILALGLTAAAAQAQETPEPGYTQFAGCPSEKENPNSNVCVRTDITGGHFQMGSKTVQIDKQITLTGGLDAELENFVFNSKGGLTKVPLKVPGGVVGITGLDWLLDLFSIEELDLYATTELAGVPDPNVFKPPVEFPIKVKLTDKNGLLGNNCYVGSNANPIALNLTFGKTNPPAPNQPIEGVSPEFEFDFETSITHLRNGTFVDNSFAAPGATGCALNLGLLSVPINDLVNFQAGLPAKAGTNETQQEVDNELTDSEIVYGP